MLSQLGGWQLLLAALVGLLLDRLIGEVRRYHPLVGFGRCASWLEARVNHAAAGRAEGIWAWVLMVLPLVLASIALLITVQLFSVPAALLLHAVILYFCIGLRSLAEHNLAIRDALLAGDLPAARMLTGRIVSRDTEHGDAAYLAKASVESVLENGCDAVFGTLFWFAVAGGPGALLYRAANTLDAMWGYRSPRFLLFGWAAARIDDGLNWIPARLTALTYALLGNTRLAWQCWRSQAPSWPSPNAGPVMAAGAGALELALGRAARYDGQDEIRPPLGYGAAAQADDILRACKLVSNTCLVWMVCAAILVLLIYAAAYLSGGAYA